MNSLFERRFLWLATAVLLAAALFRIYALQDIPPGMSKDEIFNLGMPSFILQGNFAFFFPQAYGHEPLYHYLGIPFYWMLGENFLTARLPSVFAGMLLIALTMRWAKRDFSAITAITAGALMAVSWWAIIFSRMGIRAILLPFCLVAVAWFWPRPNFRRTRPFMAGLFLGLSLYTYTGARVMFALPVLFALLQMIFIRDSATRKIVMRTSAIVFLLTVVLYIPMFLTLRANPASQERVEQLAGPLNALMSGDLTPILQSTIRTLGVFTFTGDPRWSYMIAERPLFDIIVSLFLYTGFIIAIWRIRKPQYSLLLCLTFLGLLPSAITPDAPSTIRIVGSLPAVFILIGLATAKLADWGAVSKNRASYFAAGSILLLIGLVAGRTIYHGFITWAWAPETRMGHYQTAYLVMTDYWRDNPSARTVVTDTFFEEIDIYSFNRDLGFDNGARWVQSGDKLGGAIVLPDGEGDGRLLVPEFAPINPLLLQLATVNEPLHRSTTDPSFTVYELLDEVAISELDEPIVFDNKIQLQGYDIVPSASGDRVQLVTVWQVSQPLPWDLKAFVHLIDGAGNVVAQHDGFDAAPIRLRTGDRVVQLHTIFFPMTELDAYELNLGLYTIGNGRLTHGGDPQDRIIITP